jgi:hypothetical protein
VKFRKRHEVSYTLKPPYNLGIVQQIGVDRGDAEELAAPINGPYFEASAKTSANTDGIFEVICDRIARKLTAFAEPDLPRFGRNVVAIPENRGKTKSGCC